MINVLNFDRTKAFLDKKVEQYNHVDFIANDPISIPHLFTRKQDIEIIGFWIAMLSWGQRVTIIKKGKELIDLMDGAPFDFIVNHQKSDLKRILEFKHRTFNAIDTEYFISFLRFHYTQFESLEDAFLPKKTLYFANDITTETIENNLNFFRAYFFSLSNAPSRTKKHVSSPLQKSTCKRLNMFLRWMVRKDDKGVDFGLWDKIKASQLVCPCDLHVDRVARKLGLINRKQTDWLTAIELTNSLNMMDAEDPVKYDYALFSLGVEREF